MNKWMIGCTGGMVAAAIAVSFAIQHRTGMELRERKVSFQQQADQLARLSAENDGLSNIIAQVQSSRPLSRDQLGELLRLRSEAGKLQEASAEKERLQAANLKIRAAAEKSEQQLAEARSLPNFWARDQLSFAGSADPESAVRTMLWMMNNGDVVSWLSHCTPEALAKMEAEFRDRGRSEAQRIADIKTMAHELISPSAGFHVVDRKFRSTNEAVVSLSFDGEGKTRKFILRKIGDEWKFHDLIFAGQGEPDP